MRVTNAICQLKAEFIKMPTNREKELTAKRMLDRFQLPRFAFAVDGVLAKFDSAPRGIPEGVVKQDYWTRKQCYAINCQVVGSDERLVHDVDCDWHGSAHDARIWRTSLVKRVLEQQREHLVAGDSGYPISDVLIKPYTTQESLQDATKRLFNQRLSGLRTVQSENIFGIWKSKYPCVNHHRSHVSRTKKIIIATIIFHNISIFWDREENPPPHVGGDHNLPGDPDPGYDSDNPHQDDNNDFVIVEDNATPEVVRMRGQILRDQLREGMSPRQRRRAR
jgi:hypothetical protein